MVKRTREEVRKAILKSLLDGNVHSFAYLERKVNTNWQTVRDHSKELSLFLAVSLKDNKVKITRFGREVLKRMK